MAQYPEAIFIGKIAVDIVINRSKDVLKPITLSPGGSIFNTAIIASRLGTRSGIFSSLGNDDLGKFVKDFIKKEKLNFYPISRSDNHKTAIALALIDRFGNSRYSFYKNDTRVDYKIGEDLINIFSKAKAAYMGSSFTYADETFDISQVFVELAKAHSLKLFYDPNIRAASIIDPAKARKRILFFVKKADFLKLSLDDIKFIAGTRNVGMAYKKISSFTKAAIIITRGKAGSVAFVGRKQIRTGSFNVAVKDTIGAGDAFGAALISRFSSSSSEEEFLNNIKEHITFASAVSAVTCSKHGAMEGVKSLNRINKFLRCN